MPKKDNEARCVLTLPLRTEPWQEHILQTRFRIVEQLINALIKKEKRKLYELENTRRYRELMEQIKNTPKERRKPLWAERRKMLSEAGFSEFAFKDDITPMQKHFKSHIASHVAHRAASDVWRAFEKHLYHGAKMIHWKERGSLTSVANQHAGTTMDFRNGTFIWSGGRDKNSITVKIPAARPDTEYERLMLEKEAKYFRVIQRWSKSKYKYYLQIMLVGTPVQKERTVGNGRVGIDIGPQTAAIVSDRRVMLLELADQVNDNHRKIQALQQKMDRSRRAANPENYNPDGTICRGKKLTHNHSHRYDLLAGQLRELQRKNAAIRTYQHTCLANEIISLGTEVIVEDMDFRALQRRAKKTTVNRKGRYNRKKRFGKSLANKAPAEFLAILSRKLTQLTGQGIHKVDKWSYRASQYDHITGEYHKKGLGVRWTTLGNDDYVQRDMYSAFLLMNSNAKYTAAEQELCEKRYSHFKEMHDCEILRIRADGHRYPSSFGFA